jgi:transmembrane sensor
MDGSALDEIDWAIIDRFLAGECTSAEAALVRRWLLANPGAREFLRRLPGVLESESTDQSTDPSGATTWNADAAWMRLASEQADLGAQGLTAGGPVLPARYAVLGRAARRGERGVWMAAAAVIAVIGTIAVARRAAEHALGIQGAPMRQYATAAGERATVRLSDGTELTLAPLSRVRVPLSYGRSAREVMLEGEAVFTVVHDAGRPFAVRAGSAIARDVGTRFDVRAYGDDRAVRVAVAEGRVSVTATGSRGIPGTPAGAGDVAVVTDAAVALTHGADVASMIAWTDGRLVFDGAPVADVLGTIGRWYDIDVTVATPALAGRYVTATFTNASADEVLASLAVTLDARVERHGRIVTLVALRASHDN